MLRMALKVGGPNSYKEGDEEIGERKENVQNTVGERGTYRIGLLAGGGTGNKVTDDIIRKWAPQVMG